jgi:colanic acid biosynthesis glycosyl transferase WcaI
MRILYISQYFDPENHFKASPFACELRRRGHEVRVITGFPHYPGGKVYPGYKVRPWQREVLHDIPVLRVALYPSHDRRALARIATYASFGVTAAIGAVVLDWRPDVVYAYHAPATVALAAIAMRTLRRVPFVYDINDLWPDSLTATGMVNSGAILGVVDWWCRITYRNASRIVVIAPGLKRALVQRGVPADKVSVIYNWCDQKSLVPPDVAPDPSFEDHFVVLFAGNIGIAQRLDTVLEAARHLASSAPQVRFVIVGGGVAENALREQAQIENLRNVVFLGHRPPREMGPLFARANALLVHLKADPLFEISIPSKTQAYLAAGKPILMGVRGDAADLVRNAEAGFQFEPEDSVSLVEAIHKLIALPESARFKMGESGRRYYERYLSLEAGVTAYEHEFQMAIRH